MLKQLIIDQYGIDIDELAGGCEDIMAGSSAGDHEKAIEACATVIFVAFNHKDVLLYSAAAKLLFAIGYKAGRDAPDSIVFDPIVFDPIVFGKHV